MIPMMIRVRAKQWATTTIDTQATRQQYPQVR
jgi:hypothetical protein